MLSRSRGIPRTALISLKLKVLQSCASKRHQRAKLETRRSHGRPGREVGHPVACVSRKRPPKCENGSRRSSTLPTTTFSISSVRARQNKRFWTCLMIPRPGEVWLADLGLAAKTRPVVIVSRQDPDPPRAIALYLPLTTQRRPRRYEVPLPQFPYLDREPVANVQGPVRYQQCGSPKGDPGATPERARVRP
ncbi:hypothetical protein SBA3_2580008 [Candidatus Sulfopaludibacter sp. SbA3]|nr:hypothetical protein SBA3_2580008 [Candidatus Sulfopaludibacter sp. SbA3]